MWKNIGTTKNMFCILLIRAFKQDVDWTVSTKKLLYDWKLFMSDNSNTSCVSGHIQDQHDNRFLISEEQLDCVIKRNTIELS